MILSPVQIKLMRQGLPTTPANIGGDSSSSSSQQTTNNTTTVTQDRRLVTDNGGIGISADSSSISLSLTDHGAIQAATDLGKTALTESSKNTSKLLDAAAALNEAGFDMLKANGDWAKHLIDSASAQNQAAITTVANVVSKPLDMQDPKNILVAVGVIAVGIIAVMAFRRA